MPVDNLRELSLFAGARSAVDSLEQNSLDGEPVDMSNGNLTAKQSSPKGSKTAYWKKPQYSEMSVSSLSPVRPSSTEELRMWLQQAFPVSPSVSQESNWQQMTIETCGLQRGMSFASYSQNPFCLRTCQDLFPADISDPSCLTWPRWGMWADGEFWELEMSALHIGATGCSSWPTPTKHDAHGIKNLRSDTNVEQGGRHSVSLTHIAIRPNLWPTPTAHNAKEGGVSSRVHTEHSHADGGSENG